MLPRFRLLQVGDVHLPSAIHTNKSVDDKDPRFPRDLVKVISKHPLKRAFEKIYELISAGDVSAIIFMGDFTNIGDLSGYKACASYIASALQIGSKGHLSRIEVGIVSGNHDIDRALAKSASNTDKFIPLSKALLDQGLPRLPIKEPSWIDFKLSSISASIALLNSCWGCGSAEFIPEEFRNDVQAAIDQAISRGTTQKEITAYYERQFDTPAFATDAIQRLVAEAHERAANLFVVAAHHNLLPQRQPRLAPYTELVNSGALRSVLQELGKPVVYLHGHIHQDPIEILHVPGGLPLVTISAPEIVEGFNVVEFVFTKGGMPLSCRLIKWRFDGAGFLKPGQPITVPLIGHRRRSQSDSLSELYRIVLEAREIYWDELQSRAYKLYSSASDMEEEIELLEADNKITIENYSMPPQNWIIGAKL